VNRAMCVLLLVTTLTAPAALSATHPKTAPPPPPASAPNVTATAGNSQVALAWPGVDGATRYHVFRSVSGASASDLVARVSVKYFKDYGLTNGITSRTEWWPSMRAASGPFRPSSAPRRSGRQPISRLQPVTRR